MTVLSKSKTSRVLLAVLFFLSGNTPVRISSAVKISKIFLSAKSIISELGDFSRLALCCLVDADVDGPATTFILIH